MNEFSIIVRSPIVLLEEVDRMIESKKTVHNLEIKVPNKWNHLSVEHILRNIWKLPRKTIHRIRMEKAVLKNGETVPFSSKLTTGDRLIIKNVFHEQDTGYPILPVHIHILYEDDFLLVVNKPAEMSTHPNSPGERNTLANAASHYLQAKGEKGRVYHIHRLDKDTTGAVLFAKSTFVGTLLDKMLTERSIKRTYSAFVHGELKSKEGIINKKIGRDRHHPTRRRVSPTGQEAVTHYKTLSYNPVKNISQIQCQLETGRTHQIRVHLSSIGHPIVGDLYMEEAIISRQALHAEKLTFVHPLTLENITVVALFG